MPLLHNAEIFIPQVLETFEYRSKTHYFGQKFEIFSKFVFL